MPLLITRNDVARLFASDYLRVVGAILNRVESGYREIAAGTHQEHTRIYLRSKNDPERRPPGLFTMSALLGDAGLMGTRLLALGGTTAEAGDGMLILFDQRAKRCLAIVWDPGLHDYRSGAPAGVAARYLARPDAETVGVIGSAGISAGTLAMIRHVRPSIARVRVFSPTPAHRERFAERMRNELSCDVRAVGSADEAARGADIVITATDADRPVVTDAAIAPGTYVAVMARNEIETATFLRSRTVLSSRAAWDALDPPLREPMPSQAIVGELADVVTGAISVPYRPDDVTVFAGCAPLAMWDVAAVAAVFEVARDLGIGKEISLLE